MTKMEDHNLEVARVLFGNKFLIILTCSILFVHCTPKKNHNITISKERLYGEWVLKRGEKQINYPYIEFFYNDSAVFHSRADTIYEFTFFIKKDSLYLVDIYGKKYVNKIMKLNDRSVIFEGLADVTKTQVYEK